MLQESDPDLARGFEEWKRGAEGRPVWRWRVATPDELGELQMREGAALGWRERETPPPAQNTSPYNGESVFERAASSMLSSVDKLARAVADGQAAPPSPARESGGVPKEPKPCQALNGTTRARNILLRLSLRPGQAAGRQPAKGEPASESSVAKSSSTYSESRMSRQAALSAAHKGIQEAHAEITAAMSAGLLTGQMARRREEEEVGSDDDDYTVQSVASFAFRPEDVWKARGDQTLVSPSWSAMPSAHFARVFAAKPATVWQPDMFVTGKFKFVSPGAMDDSMTDAKEADYAESRPLSNSDAAIKKYNTASSGVAGVCDLLGCILAIEAFAISLWALMGPMCAAAQYVLEARDHVMVNIFALQLAVERDPGIPARLLVVVEEIPKLIVRAVVSGQDVFVPTQAKEAFLMAVRDAMATLEKPTAPKGGGKGKSSDDRDAFNVSSGRPLAPFALSKAYLEGGGANVNKIKSLYFPEVAELFDPRPDDPQGNIPICVSHLFGCCSKGTTCGTGQYMKKHVTPTSLEYKCATQTWEKIHQI